MITKPHRKLNPFYIGLLASFVAHLILISNLAFTFTPKFSDSRPNFIFLGSILRKINISKNPFSNDQRSHTTIDTFLDPATINSPVKIDPVVVKPHNLPKGKQSNKVSLKSNFLKEENSEIKPKRSKTDEFELPTEKYQPLRYR